MKRKTILKQGRRAAIGACCLLLGGAMVQSCQDDALTGQPSWLGNSIYERLQEDGSYTTVLRLIDDLDLAEVLGHTGSKTLFVASDSAYAAWYRHNDWGVSSYEELSDAQKKMLLNNSMISNAYLIELMSNVSGTPPVEGKAMRRETALSIYDSVYVMHPDEMPTTEAWAGLKAAGRSIPLLKDDASAPMIHFLPAYMSFNEITDEDLAILTNGQAASASEAWVNGKKVVERDITCKNGYIQKVDGVIESAPNMAEIMRLHPQMSMWSHLVDRFSAPYRNDAATTEYQRIYNTKDTVYTLRYFSKRAAITQRASNPSEILYLPDNVTPVPEQLSFDPGWNHYMYSNTMGYDLHYDAGAMIVPTNEALEAWWNKGGKDLQDEYKTWDSIPEITLSKLINVNMLPTFSESVPSKFAHVLNDAKDVLGITKNDVDSCFMGCNGVVYMVNKVFTPAEFASVAYPALAHESTMSIVYWAIDQLNFLPYLLSMDSRYALLLPTNEAMKQFIDPSTYGNLDVFSGMEGPSLIEFTYDKSKTISNRVQASRSTTSVDADGNITPGYQIETEDDFAKHADLIRNMLNDLVDQLIIVIPDSSMTLESYVAQGYSLFKTKGGSLIRVSDDGAGHLAFEGGWQMEHNHKKLVAQEVFSKQNGRSYVLDTQMPLGAQKSLYMTLREHQDEYGAFLRLLENDYSGNSLLSLEMNSKYTPANSRGGNKNMRLFDNYNYTVFVPRSSAITQLQAQGYLPTWDELVENFEDRAKHYSPVSGRELTSVLDSICDAENWYRFAKSQSQAARDSLMADVKECVKNIVVDFVRYHIMDRSVAVGMAPEANASGSNYESMKRNPETGRFFPLVVDCDQRHLSVTDVMNTTHEVVLSEGLYNNVCREYWFDTSGGANNTTLYMCSDAVVHLIDQPLLYEPMKPWRDVVTQYLMNK